MIRRGVGAVAAVEARALPRSLRTHHPRPTPAQRRWLTHGLSQPGGKLPLFDEYGQTISQSTVRSCIRHGWVEPWIRNPIKPDWLVCRLTRAGRLAVGG
jgi:hypothetical protein